MYTTHLRKVGGSVMLAVPPAILDLLHLHSGSPVGLTVENNRLLVESIPQTRYTLDALLSQCDASAKASDEDRAWLDDTSKGNELL